MTYYTEYTDVGYESALPDVVEQGPRLATVLTGNPRVGLLRRLFLSAARLMRPEAPSPKPIYDPTTLSYDIHSLEIV